VAHEAQLQLPLTQRRTNELIQYRIEQLEAKLAAETCAGKRVDLQHDIERLRLLIAQPTPREVSP